MNVSHQQCPPMKDSLPLSAGAPSLRQCSLLNEQAQGKAAGRLLSHNVLIGLPGTKRIRLNLWYFGGKHGNIYNVWGESEHLVENEGYNEQQVYCEKKVSRAIRREKAKLSVRNSACHSALHLTSSNLITLRLARGIKILSCCQNQGCLPDVKPHHLLYSLQVEFILQPSSPIKSADLHCFEERALLVRTLSQWAMLWHKFIRRATKTTLCSLLQSIWLTWL